MACFSVTLTLQEMSLCVSQFRVMQNPVRLLLVLTETARSKMDIHEEMSHFLFVQPLPLPFPVMARGCLIALL
jgi:hypothetical protein